METQPRRGGLVGPVVLIGAGVVFLLTNLGLLSWDVWDTLLKFWPILLIAVGLDLLIGRRSLLGSLLVVAFLFVALGVAIWVAVPDTATGDLLTTEQVRQSLDGAKRAEVEIGAGVGQLRITALPESSGLIEGQVAVARDEEVTSNFRKQGDTARYVLRSRYSPIWWPGRFGERDWERKIWDLQLNRDVPMALMLSTGVGKSEIDLSGLHITDLDVNVGVGQVAMTLPRLGRVQAEVDGGVGEVRIMIPSGVAARIHVDGGLGMTDVDGNYQRRGEDYISPGYDTADNRVALEISGGIGRVLVRELVEE